MIEDGAPSVRTLSGGQRAMVRRGHWHSNYAPDRVTMLWLTPSEGNEHSWEAPRL